MAIKQIKLPDNTKIDINDSRIHIYRNLTGTAGTGTSPYRSTKWDVTDSTVTAYEDGMVVSIKVPVAGTGTYGDVFQINDLGYKPVVYGANSTIGTRYPVGGVIWMQYNSTQTASWYNDSSSATSVTGCWQVMDYDANTTSIYTLVYYRGTRVCAADVRRYILCVFPDETTILPLNSTAGSGNAGSTATTKTMTTGTFDPSKGIVYYATNAVVTSGNAVAMSAMYRQNTSVDLRYSFNCGTTSFTANSEVYMVMDLQSDGRLCKLASTPYSDTLPSTNDGHLYMLLGFAYSKYQIELYPIHPIYYHDGTGIKLWNGPTELPALANNANKILAVNSSATGVQWIPNSGGGGGDIEYVNFTETGSVWSCDTSIDDILSYVSNGKTVYGMADLQQTVGGNVIMPIIGYLSNASAKNVIFEINFDNLDVYFVGEKVYEEGSWTSDEWTHVEEFKQDVVYCEFNGSTCSMTVQEIYNAFTAGKAVICNASSGINDAYSSRILCTMTRIVYLSESYEGAGDDSGFVEFIGKYEDSLGDHDRVYCIQGYGETGSWSWSGNDLFYIDYLQDAITKRHSHSNKTQLDKIPSTLGTAGQVLTVNSGATGMQWSNYPNYDFVELSAPTITSNATTITFVANQRNGIDFSTNADLSIALISNNKSDNYIWITNSHSTDDIDVSFSSIKFGTTTINDVAGTDTIPTIEAGKTIEIGVYVTTSKARITSRIL